MSAMNTPCPAHTWAAVAALAVSHTLSRSLCGSSCSLCAPCALLSWSTSGATRARRGSKATGRRRAGGAEVTLWRGPRGGMREAVVTKRSARTCTSGAFVECAKDRTQIWDD